MGLKLRTRVFDVGKEKYVNLTELAIAMGISVPQIYRVKQGKRSINGKFITGAIKAFPGYKVDALFYVSQDGNESDHRKNRIGQNTQTTKGYDANDTN